MSAISVAPVKSLALSHPSTVVLHRDHVVGDKALFLVDEAGKLFVSRRCPHLCKVQVDFHDGFLQLAFPDGSVVAGEIQLGAATVTPFYSFRTVPGHEVAGPWSDALSEYAQRRVRLVKAQNGDGYDLAPVTIVSGASLDRLEREAGAPVDHRRFRMLFQVAGCTEHEEDSWNRVAIGEAIVRVGSALGGPVPRCDVVTRDPDTAVRNLDVLRLIKGYRGRTSEGVVFGVYASIERPGRVSLGDAVEPLR